MDTMLTMQSINFYKMDAYYQNIRINGLYNYKLTNYNWPQSSLNIGLSKCFLLA